MLRWKAKGNKAMPKLTRAERENCIGYKALLIAKDRQGNIARVTSPQTLSKWEFDGPTWILAAHQPPTEDNTTGVYVTFSAKEARKYLGTLCKVILSGRVVIHENGARGEVGRLLEVSK
jgi:hypothetical protein